MGIKKYTCAMKKLYPLLLIIMFFSAPAFAASACYSPAELQAEHLLRLHSELMVITVTCRTGSQGEDLVATSDHAIAYFDPGGEWEPEVDSKWKAGSKELQAFAVGVCYIRRVCSPACTSLTRPDLGVDDRQVSVRKRLGPMKIRGS